jgi:hypothetical protein
MPAVQIGQTAPLTISLRLAGSAHRNRVGSAQRYASDEQARNTTQESEIPTNKKAGIRTWARFSPQIMRGIMRAVGAIMRSPNMDRRF